MRTGWLTAEKFYLLVLFQGGAASPNPIQLHTNATLNPIQDYLRGDIVHESKVVYFTIDRYDVIYSCTGLWKRPGRSSMYPQSKTAPTSKPLPFDRADIRNANPPLGPAQIGQTKTWLGIDDYRGVINIKNYMLRGVGTHVEVWVNPDLRFPNPQMRNPLDRGPERLLHLQRLSQPRWRSRITHHRRAGQLPDRPVRQQHVPDRVGLVERSAEPQRQQEHSRQGSSASRRATTRARATTSSSSSTTSATTNFYDQDNAEPEVLHRRLLLQRLRRLRRPDCDVGRRVGLAAPHRCRPAHDPTSDPCTSAPARPFLYEGVVRPRVPAPPAPLHRSG